MYNDPNNIKGKPMFLVSPDTRVSLEVVFDNCKYVWKAKSYIQRLVDGYRIKYIEVTATANTPETALARLGKLIKTK